MNKDTLLTNDDVLHMVDFGEVPRNVPRELSALALRKELLGLSVTLGRETGLQAFDIYTAAVPAINNSRI